jgi:hypothetical protein
MVRALMDQNQKMQPIEGRTNLLLGAGTFSIIRWGQSTFPELTKVRQRRKDPRETTYRVLALQSPSATQQVSVAAASQSLMLPSPMLSRHHIRHANTLNNPFLPGALRTSQGPSPPSTNCPLEPFCRQLGLISAHQSQKSFARASADLMGGWR